MPLNLPLTWSLCVESNEVIIRTSRGQKGPSTHFQTMWPASLSAKQQASELVMSNTPRVTLPLVCVCVFKVKEEALHLLWSLSERLSLRFHALFCHWKDLWRSQSAGCWHLAVAPPVDKITLRYWPVCWKACVSLYFERSKSMYCLNGASVGAMIVINVLCTFTNILLHVSLLLCNYSLFFAPSVTFLAIFYGTDPTKDFLK